MLSEVQRILLAALQDPDPLAVVRRELERPGAPLAAAERSMLAGLTDHGLRMSRFVVRKLRLQRLLAGDRDAARAMAADAARFAATFRSYDAEVPNEAVFPSEEARRFAAWQRARAAQG